MMLDYRAQRVFIKCTLLLTVLIVGGCTKEKPTVNVNVEGVNYAADAFSYQLVDPDRPEEIIAGDEINSFEGSGTNCCYPLPRQWRPGIKVKVKVTHWLPQDKDGNLPEVNEEYVSEVPPYVDGKPGELWVVRAADGTVSVLSSDYQPDHVRWPGKVKGWPVPSLEYRRARWKIMRDHEQDFVNTFASVLRDLEKEPRKVLTESWEYDMKDDPKLLAPFTGRDDPKYLDYVRKRYQDALESSKASLARVEKGRP